MKNEKFEFYVAGVKHHEIYKCLDEMEVGQHLQMEPELENEYDPNAVSLHYPAPGRDHDVMIGYVPVKISRGVTDMLGPGVCCRIVELDKYNVPWRQVKVVIEES